MDKLQVIKEEVLLIKVSQLPIPLEIKEYAIACTTGKMLREYVPSELVKYLFPLIIRMHANTGYTYNEVITTATIEELAIDLIKEHGILTLAEVSLAFTRGYKKMYGDFFGLNNMTYFVWVKEYCKEENRTKAKIALMKLQEELKNPKKELSEEEKEKLTVAGIISSFVNFKNNIHVMVPSAFYDYLKRKNTEHFSFTDNLKKTFMDNAKSEIISEQTLKKSASPTMLSKSITDYIEEVQKSGNKHGDIITRAKQIAVKHWFGYLIENKKNIGEILEIKK